MEKKVFDRYYQHLLRKASAKRAEKEEEYASVEDVLGNFRSLARFRNTSVPGIIMDLGSKSLQSISDMTDEEFNFDNAEPFSMELWEEKFVDAVNYLFKLYASIREARDV